MNSKLKNLLTLLVAVAVVAFGGVNLLDSPEKAPAQPSVAVMQQEPEEIILPVSDGASAEAAEPEESTNEAQPEDGQEPEETAGEAQVRVQESGQYTSRDEVAAYLHQFGHLPSNYITKQKAQDLGWVNSEGNLNKVAPGKSIGGDRFGNYEGQLPAAKGRKYWECDIDFGGRFRNAKRIIYSNDGLIYYTEDHYETFELLYGRE